MKYKVKDTGVLYKLQYKEHWYNRWKTFESTTDIAEAYNIMMTRQSNGKCWLPYGKYFAGPNGKQLWCELKIGRLPTNDSNYNDGKHYYAGYKNKNSKHFSQCSYGDSYLNAIYTLFNDLYVKDKLIKSHT